MPAEQSHHRKIPGPHANQPVRHAGAPLKTARAALLLVHGRGASAESMLSLYDELGTPPMAALAPQAAGHTWYPHSFLAPIPANQPWLDSALAQLESLVGEILAEGVPSERIALLG